MVSAGDKPVNELDAALAAYQHASLGYRQAKERRDRLRRDHERADQEFIEAGHVLQAARGRLDKALDADGVE